MNNLLNDIIIVGGGTAGWMTASALSVLLPKNKYNITLVESDLIGTIGVGEATIPPIRQLNRVGNIDEQKFMKRTGATFKLGIEFHNWRVSGEHYFHPFGKFGKSFDGLHIHQ